MTIIEVLFAVVILSGVMLALSRFGQGFARANRNAAYLTTASDLATARLEAARAHGNYATLVSSFDGVTSRPSSRNMVICASQARPSRKRAITCCAR